MFFHIHRPTLLWIYFCGDHHWRCGDSGGHGVLWVRTSLMLLYIGARPDFKTSIPVLFLKAWSIWGYFFSYLFIWSGSLASKFPLMCGCRNYFLTASLPLNQKFRIPLHRGYYVIPWCTTIPHILIYTHGLQGHIPCTLWNYGVIVSLWETYSSGTYLFQFSSLYLSDLSPSLLLFLMLLSISDKQNMWSFDCLLLCPCLFLRKYCDSRFPHLCWTWLICTRLLHWIKLISLFQLDHIDCFGINCSVWIDLVVFDFFGLDCSVWINWSIWFNSFGFDYIWSGCVWFN